jgi:endo-1,4-beta-xylanase
LEYDTPFVSREIMKLRLENYIKNVLTHFQEKYPGVIFAWDVVNEAIETADGREDGLRDSLWLQVIGPDYIELAFTYARQYADPDVLLFYNDYNTFIPERTALMLDLVRDLKEKELLDGMGMQSHILMDFPTLPAYENTIRAFCELGVEVHITELDIRLGYDDVLSLSSQGRRYARLAEIYTRLYDEGLPVNNVTVWGIVDNRSWLNADGVSYHLLFARHFQPKPAFWGFYDHEEFLK